MEKRWHQHCAQAVYSKGGRWHFPNAIRKYGKNAFSHRILEICDSLEKANSREEAWIELFETRDPQFGFNLAKGGGSQPHPIRKNPWDDPEYRTKCTEAAKITFSRPDVRAAHDAQMQTMESKIQRSIISKEIHSRPEVRAKNSAALKGRTLSIEHRQKIADNQRNMSAESRMKRSIKNHGRKPSLETRAKISAKGTGRKHTLEARAKMSAARKGKPLSEEHKAKLSAIYKKKNID
jgi:NUMOD3 motif